MREWRNGIREGFKILSSKEGVSSSLTFRTKTYSQVEFMLLANSFEVIVTRDTDGKISVWWRKDLCPSQDYPFMRLKEGKTDPERTEIHVSFHNDEEKYLRMHGIQEIMSHDPSLPIPDVVRHAILIMEFEKSPTALINIMSKK